MLRAFTPHGLGLVALACQWPPSSGSTSSATTASPPASTSPAAAGDPCLEPVQLAEPSARATGVSTSSFALRPALAHGELPGHSAELCLDRWAPPSSYGEGASQPLERACERVLGPGCRDDERTGLRRVLNFHYVQQKDPAQGVDGVLSLFGDSLGAYAHFTHAVLGDGDPAELVASGLDRGNLVQRADAAFAWRGKDVLWLRLADERQTAAAREQAAQATLPGLAREILAGLGDSDVLPAPVQHLPQAERVPLGVRLLLGEAFGVSGLGPSAQGYYRDGSKRWRVATSVRADADAAEDVLQALAQRPDAQPVENAALPALKLSERGAGVGAPVVWVIGRRAEVLYGIGDAEPATGALAGTEVALSMQEKMTKLAGAGAR